MYNQKSGNAAGYNQRPFVDRKKEHENLINSLRTTPQEIESNLVGAAENVILDLKDKVGKGKIAVTKTQLRKILTAVVSLKNKVDVEVASQIAKGVNSVECVSEEMAAEIKFLKVAVIYQGSRDEKVNDFVTVAGLTDFIDVIGNSIRKFNIFNKYVEALVAYHKYYGGRD